MPKRVELFGEFYRVVQGKLRSRADGEMGGMGGVAHQNDMRPAVEMAPGVADQPVEIEPGRAAQVACVGHQARAAERFRKYLLAEGDRALLIELVETVRCERVFGGFDNERRGVAVEFIDMGLKPAMLGAPEIEREGVERLSSSKPDVAVGPHDQIGLEHVRIAVADPGIDPVSRDDQIGVWKLKVGLDVLLERELDAELLAAALQDVKQLLASDADEAVSGCALARAFEDKLDVVPVIEGVRDLLPRSRGRRARIACIIASENTTPQPKVS